MEIERQNTEPYDEKKVMESIAKQGKCAILAHLKHLKEHNEFGYLKEAMDYLVTKGIRIRPGDLMGTSCVKKVSRDRKTHSTPL